MENYKIYVDSKDFLVELEVIDDILHFQISDLKVTEDKFKNNFTYKKLIAKVDSISLFTKDINGIKNELVNAIKKSQYSFKKVDFFALFTFEIKKFPNSKKDFTLELFLYKTDSRQATLMVSELEDKVKKVIKENNELNSSYKLLNQEIENISISNTKIIEKIDSIKKEIIGVNMDKTVNIKLLLNKKTKIINEKLDKIKDTIHHSVINSRRSTTLDISQLPVLRPEDKKNLTKWFDLEFDMEKLYDSNMHSDSLESIKKETQNKTQTLTVIELDSGRRFGCYISLPFYQDSNIIDSYLTDDPFAFIFSFDRRKKFPITNKKYVVSFTNEGILFGSGPDIFISDKFHSSNKNYSHILGSYGEGEVLEEGYSRNNYLAGIEFFKIKKIEIHQIIFK